MNLKTILSNSFCRFLLVGGINAIFGYSVFALLIYLGLHYTIAVFIGTVLGILFNFQTIGRLVFTTARRLDPATAGKFFVVYGVTYLFNIFGIYLFSLVNVGSYLAGALLILPVAVIGFLLNKKFVFKPFN